MVWDRHAIRAEIYRRGETLRSLSKANGLERNSCTVSLARPFPKADRVVSRFLGVPLHVLWPHRYDRHGNSLSNRIRPSAKTARNASPKTSARADMGAVS